MLCEQALIDAEYLLPSPAPPSFSISSVQLQQSLQLNCQYQDCKSGVSLYIAIHGLTATWSGLDNKMQWQYLDSSTMEYQPGRRTGGSWRGLGNHQHITAVRDMTLRLMLVLPLGDVQRVGMEWVTFLWWPPQPGTPSPWWLRQSSSNKLLIVAHLVQRGFN